MNLKGLGNSVISGCLASLAAVFTKVGFNFGEGGTINEVYMTSL